MNVRDKHLSETSKTRVKEFCKLIDAIMSTQVQNLVVEGFRNFLRYFGMELEVVPESFEKGGSNKYRIDKSALFTVPYRFVIQATIKIPKDSGFEVLADIKNVPFIKIRPENQIALIPSSFEEFKKLIRTMLMLPIKSTRHCIPKVQKFVTADFIDNENSWIRTVDLHDPLLSLTMSSIESTIGRIWTDIEREISVFQKYFFLAQDDLYSSLEDNNELETFEDVATQILDAKSGLSSQKLGVDFRPLYLDCSFLVQALNKTASASIEKVSMALTEKIIESCDYLELAYSELDAKISLDPGHDVQKV